MAYHGDPRDFTLTPTVQHIICPCNTIGDFPQRCPYHAPATTFTPWTPAPDTTRPNVSPYRFTPYEGDPFPGEVPSDFRPEVRLTDGDIERIARRVAEILKKDPQP